MASRVVTSGTVWAITTVTIRVVTSVASRVVMSATVWAITSVTSDGNVCNDLI